MNFGFRLVSGLGRRHSREENPGRLCGSIVKANPDLGLCVIKIFGFCEREGDRRYHWWPENVEWHQVKEAFQQEFSMLKGLRIDVWDLKVCDRKKAGLPWRLITIERSKQWIAW